MQNSFRINPLLFLLVLAVSPFTARADDSGGETSLYLRGGIYSKYVFRGANLYDALSFQPNVSLYHDLGKFGRIGAGVWAHIPIEDGQTEIVDRFEADSVFNPQVKFVEVDPTLSWDMTFGIVTVSVGHTWYTDPDDGRQRRPRPPGGQPAAAREAPPGGAGGPPPGGGAGGPPPSGGGESSSGGAPSGSTGASGGGGTSSSSGGAPSGGGSMGGAPSGGMMAPGGEMMAPDSGGGASGAMEEAPPPGNAEADALLQVSRGDTSEWYASIAIDTFLNPEITVVVDYRRFDYEYYTLGFSESFKVPGNNNFTLRPFLKFAWSTGNNAPGRPEDDDTDPGLPDASGFYEDNGLVHIDVGVSGRVQLGSIALIPSLTYVFVQDDFAGNDDIVWGGLAIDYDHLM